MTVVNINGTYVCLCNELAFIILISCDFMYYKIVYIM